MPAVLRIGPYSFSFYSNERNEPQHVHVKGNGQEAKIWLADCSVARNSGFPGHELREIARLVYENRQDITDRWVEQFGHA